MSFIQNKLVWVMYSAAFEDDSRVWDFKHYTRTLAPPSDQAKSKTTPECITIYPEKELRNNTIYNIIQNQNMSVTDNKTWVLEEDLASVDYEYYDYKYDYKTLAVYKSSKNLEETFDTKTEVEVVDDVSVESFISESEDEVLEDSEEEGFLCENPYCSHYCERGFCHENCDLVEIDWKDSESDTDEYLIEPKPDFEELELISPVVKPVRKAKRTQDELIQIAENKLNKIIEKQRISAEKDILAAEKKQRVAEDNFINEIEKQRIKVKVVKKVKKVKKVKRVKIPRVPIVRIVPIVRTVPIVIPKIKRNKPRVIKDVIQTGELTCRIIFEPKNKKVVKINPEPELKIDLAAERRNKEAEEINQSEQISKAREIKEAEEILQAAKIKQAIKQAEHDKRMEIQLAEREILQAKHDKMLILQAEREIKQAEHDKQMKILLAEREILQAEHHKQMVILQAENIKEVEILQAELKILQAEPEIIQPDDNNSQIIVEQIEAEYESEDESEYDHSNSCFWCYQRWKDCECICDKCSNPKNVCKNDKYICWELEKKKIEAEESEAESDNNSPINCNPEPKKLSIAEVLFKIERDSKNRKADEKEAERKEKIRVKEAEKAEAQAEKLRLKEEAQAEKLRLKEISDRKTKSDLFKANNDLFIKKILADMERINGIPTKL